MFETESFHSSIRNISQYVASSFIKVDYKPNKNREQLWGKALFESDSTSSFISFYKKTMRSGDIDQKLLPDTVGV